MKKKDNKKKKLIELKENYLDKIRIKLFSFPSSSIKDEKNEEEIIVVNNNQVNKDDKNKNAYFCWIRKVKVPKNNYEKIKIEVKFKVGNEFLIVDLNTVLAAFLKKKCSNYMKKLYMINSKEKQLFYRQMKILFNFGLI